MTPRFELSNYRGVRSALILLVLAACGPHPAPPQVPAARKETLGEAIHRIAPNTSIRRHMGSTWLLGATAEQVDEIQRLLPDERLYYYAPPGSK